MISRMTWCHGEEASAAKAKGELPQQQLVETRRTRIEMRNFVEGDSPWLIVKAVVTIKGFEEFSQN